jgi:hypothetical protein
MIVIQYNHSPYSVKLFVQFSKRPIEMHDVLRLLETFDAEACPEETKGQLSLILRHVLEARALPRREVPVVPLAPIQGR